MANSSRLLSVLQYLANSHRDEAGLKERVDVVTASLFLVAPELSIKRLTADLLRFSQIQQVRSYSFTCTASSTPSALAIPKPEAHRLSKAGDHCKLLSIQS